MKKVFTLKLIVILVCVLALGSAVTFHNWRSPAEDGNEPRQIASADINPPPSAAEELENSKGAVPPESIHTGDADEVKETEDNPAKNDIPEITENRDLADRKAPEERISRPSDSKETAVQVPPVQEPEVKPVPETKPAPPANSHDTDLNVYVLNMIENYQHGNYPYLLNTDYQNYNGVTENLYYGGKIIGKANPSGDRASHCSGITFEVFFKAMQARNRKLGLPTDDFNGMSFSELQDFQQLWYAAGNKNYYNLAAAVEKYGLGRQIHQFEDAKRGDFLDFSRTNYTGHSVIFLDWIRDTKGKIIGLHYWSSQGSTNGINYNTEYFDYSGKGNVISTNVYIARVLPVKSYR